MNEPMIFGSKADICCGCALCTLCSASWLIAAGLVGLIGLG